MNSAEMDGMREDLPVIFAHTLFFFAVLHTFSVQHFQKWAQKYPEGSIGENFFHLIGEIEVIFALWSTVYLIFLSLWSGPSEAIRLIEGLQFNEPAFVFVIMVIASTKPVAHLAQKIMIGISQAVVTALNRTPFSTSVERWFYRTALIAGPLLGSFITEPAAMTITAVLLRDHFFRSKVSLQFKYMTLATLLVNVSIGGVLTHFAAPPVLIVAKSWNWNTPFMFMNFGWKAIVAVILNTLMADWILRQEMKFIKFAPSDLVLKDQETTPLWISAMHCLFLGAVVLSSHYIAVFIGIFLLFIAFSDVTREHQKELELREGLLVASFLGGLVILGSLQSDWLNPILKNFSKIPMFFGATALTAITDNAALTYLGSQVEGLSAEIKYSLMSGAICGGGLTVIANAPNPIAAGILKSFFGLRGIDPFRLLAFAALPTLLAMGCFWFLG